MKGEWCLQSLCCVLRVRSLVLSLCLSHFLLSPVFMHLLPWLKQLINNNADDDNKHFVWSCPFIQVCTVFIVPFGACSILGGFPQVRWVVLSAETWFQRGNKITFKVDSMCPRTSNSLLSQCPRAAPFDPERVRLYFRSAIIKYKVLQSRRK